MQAIILAAGMGRRLGELTQSNTKCMIEVNGVKLIDRLLNQLSKHDINRVIIVIGYEGNKLRDHIEKNYGKKLNFKYIHNPIYDKTNNIYSLALAQDLMKEDDTLLIESDLIFDDSLFDLILKNPYPNLALVAKYESWMDGTMVQIDENYNIISFVPKKIFKYQEKDTYYKTINIYKFSKDFSVNKYLPFLNAYCKALGNNEYYEQVLRVITYLDNSELKALPISDEKWYEIDDIHDLDIAECLFADGKNQLSRLYGCFGGFWRFPKVLDFCYLVNPYFPSKRFLDEMEDNFVTLLTEYPSGMRINSLLASKCFGVKQEYIVPGNGASELIKTIFECTKGKVGIIYPTFEEYPNRLSKEAIEVYIPQSVNYHYSVNDIIKHFEKLSITSLLLINPDNPSGNFIPFSDVIKLASWCLENNIRLILDESFVDFSSMYRTSSMLQNEYLERYPNMFVVKSISKSYGVPGLRLGILASSDTEVVEKIKRTLPIWNLNSFAEFFMQILNKYEDDYHEACEQFLVERARFYNELKEITYLRVIESEANYFLIEVLNKYSATELAYLLMNKYNILIKDCSNKKPFKDRNFIRIAVRSKKENQIIVNALKLL